MHPEARGIPQGLWQGKGKSLGAEYKIIFIDSTKEVITTIMRKMVPRDVVVLMLTWKVKALIVLLGSPSHPSLQKSIIISTQPHQPSNHSEGSLQEKNPGKVGLLDQPEDPRPSPEVGPK